MSFPRRTTILSLVVLALVIAHGTAHAQGPITNGENHQASISSPGELDTWTFTVAQGDYISLSIGEVLPAGTDPGFNPWIRLQDPNGTQLASAQGALVAQINEVAPLSGTYTVVASSWTVATGTYRLTLAHTPGTFVVPAGDEGGPVTNGANHPGVIHLGDLDQWTFTAAQGDYLSLSIGEVFPGETDPGFNPWIRLRGPNGDQLASTQGSLVAQINEVAPLSGTYTVVASSWTVATGDYRLTLAKTPGSIVIPPGDEGGPMTNGANHPGVIHLGDLDQWTFTAAQGDYLSLSIGEVFPGETDPGFNPWIRLRGPNGDQLASTQGSLVAQINEVAPLSGTYTVVASSWTVATGDYRLTLAKTPGSIVIPPGDEGGPMTNGANHPGVIHLGDLDQWTFTAAQGDYLSLSIGEVFPGETDPGFNPWIRLRGPNGDQLASVQGALVAQINEVAPLSGTYTVVASSWTVATGDYRLTLAKTPGSFVVPAGDEGGPMTNAASHPGVIHLGDLDQWTFTAAQGATLAISIGEVFPGETDPGFNPWIRLRGPNGAQLGSVQGATVAQINTTAPVTGTYTVVVASYTVNDEPGLYQLTVTGATTPPPPPISVNDAYTTPFNTPLAIPAPGVLANDNSNGGGAMTAAIHTGVATGTLSLASNGGFTYTPPASFSGTVSFTYRASNSAGAGNIATVSITVGAATPTTVNDSYSVNGDTSLTIPAPGLLANDNSNGGGALSASLVSTVGHGVLSLGANGGFSYTPSTGYVGTDSFTYRAVNAAGQGNAATVSIVVNDPTTVHPPTNLYTASVAGNVVTLRWTAPTTGSAPTNYVVEGGVHTGQVLATIPTGSAAPIYTFTAPTGAFYVRMHTLAGANRSVASNEIRIYVNVPQPPSAPANLLGMVNGTTLGLAWRNTFGGGAPVSLILDVTGSIDASLPLGLTDHFGFAGVPGGTYTLSLRAVNAGGASSSSNAVTLTFPDVCTGPPSPPANFLAHRIGNTVMVTWDSGASGTAPSGYVLNVGGSFFGSFPTSGRSMSGQVGPGSYSLNVVAINACGASAATAVQTVVIP